MLPIRLRPLVVVTGTIRVEGGAQSKRRTPARSESAGHELTVTEHVKITADRRRADVLRIKFARQLERLVILRTDFGQLVDVAKLPELRQFLTELSTAATAFNRSARTAEVLNCFVWEHLTGQRKAAVEGWIARRLGEKDIDVSAALPQLEPEPPRVVADAPTGT